jgi:PHP family Zn ribbon phosphoesterase
MAEFITHASTRLWQEVLCGASKPLDGPLVSIGSYEYVTCEDCKRLLPARQYQSEATCVKCQKTFKGSDSLAELAAHAMKGC